MVTLMMTVLMVLMCMMQMVMTVMLLLLVMMMIVVMVVVPYQKLSVHRYSFILFISSQALHIRPHNFTQQNRKTKKEKSRSKEFRL